MKLEIRDPVVAEVTRRTASTVPGVARLHELPWPASLGRGRNRDVEIDRSAGVLVVTVRLVAGRGHPVIEVVRTVQRSVRGELRRLTGLVAEVVVVVVDLD
ncbi:Asp23/Gls24 family envelope stress response protein [Jatrophihabitans sp. YIM 134969]